MRNLGLCLLLLSIEAGVARVYVRIRQAPGVLDGAEIGPSLQLERFSVLRFELEHWLQMLPQGAGVVACAHLAACSCQVLLDQCLVRVCFRQWRW